METLVTSKLKKYKEIKGRSKLPRLIANHIKRALETKSKKVSYFTLEAVVDGTGTGYRALRFVQWEESKEGRIIHDISEFNAKHTRQDILIKLMEDNTKGVDCQQCAHFRCEGASMAYPYPTAWCGKGKGDIRPDETILECSEFEEAK